MIFQRFYVSFMHIHVALLPMFFFALDLLQDEEGRCPKCSKHLEELESVKEEFERYKLRAQSVLKNKNSKVNRLRVSE